MSLNTGVLASTTHTSHKKCGRNIQSHRENCVWDIGSQLPGFDKYCTQGGQLKAQTGWKKHGYNVIVKLTYGHNFV